MKTIVIDARMINYSGIGRYIQTLLSLILKWDQYDFYLLGDRNIIEEKLKHSSGLKYNVISTKRKIYHPNEHFELAKKIPECDIFFSPHYITPFLKIKASKRITFIHDLFHIWRGSNLNFIKRMYAKILLKNALNKSDLVLTCSYFQKNEIHNTFPNSDTSVQVIYHTNETISLSRKEFIAPIQDKYILYIGNIKPHKNLSLLVDAFQEASIPDLKLVLVGESERFISKDRKMKKKLTCENVIFTGYVPDDELPNWFHFAEYLVHPSYYEGFGYPPLEAFYFNIPSLVADIPVLKEIYKDTVLYCDPYSKKSIVNGIKKLYSDIPLRFELLGYREEILNKYSFEKFENNYRKMFDSF